MSRTIQVPENIALRNLANGEVVSEDMEGNPVEPWTFHRYLTSVVLPDEAFGSGYKADRARCKLEECFRGTSPGDKIPVDDDWFDKMKTVIKHPKGLFEPQIKMQLVPFMDAVMEAK